MTKANDFIPVIDLFAGPGGLGEGFSALKVKGKHPYRLVLSVECDPFAHQTLELRAFFREFKNCGRRIPQKYNKHVRGEITREELFAAYPKETASAIQEACLARLGEEDGDKKVAEHIKRLRKEGIDFKRSIMIGGPPCQAYSLVGRSRISKVKASGEYQETNDGRHVLYRQYLKLIDKVKPAAFVMENVRGILSAQYEDELIFPKILQDLEDAGYQLHALGGETAKKNASKPTNEQQMFSFSVDDAPSTDLRDFLLKADHYGVPQKRPRVIVVGTRKKTLGSIKFKLPRASGEPMTVRESIGDLPKLRSGLSKGDDCEAWMKCVRGAANRLRRCISADAPKKTRAELEKIGKPNSRLPKMRKRKTDPRQDVFNHETRGHIALDIERYLFYAAWSMGMGNSPSLTDLPKYLLPKHENIQIAENAGTLGKVAFADRFRVQVADAPATTITSHISKDGHYYIHYDPRQCRSLTVREAARLQTFPDNYFFCGPRTEQYKQVGNAVPPLLATTLAVCISAVLAQ